MKSVVLVVYLLVFGNFRSFYCFLSRSLHAAKLWEPGVSSLSPSLWPSLSLSLNLKLSLSLELSLCLCRRRRSNASTSYVLVSSKTINSEQRVTQATSPNATCLLATLFFSSLKRLICAGTCCRSLAHFFCSSTAGGPSTANISPKFTS